jgi:hypothetical protein
MGTGVSVAAVDFDDVGDDFDDDSDLIHDHRPRKDGAAVAASKDGNDSDDDDEDTAVCDFLDSPMFKEDNTPMKGSGKEQHAFKGDHTPLELKEDDTPMKEPVDIRSTVIF